MIARILLPLMIILITAGCSVDNNIGGAEPADITGIWMEMYDTPCSGIMVDPEKETNTDTATTISLLTLTDNEYHVIFYDDSISEATIRGGSNGFYHKKKDMLLVHEVDQQDGSVIEEYRLRFRFINDDLQLWMVFETIGDSIIIIPMENGVFWDAPSCSVLPLFVKRHGTFTRVE